MIVLSQSSPPRMRVPVRGDYLENTVTDLQNGNIEGAATEVVDGDFLVRLLVQTVGQSGCRGLVDDAQHFEAGDFAGALVACRWESLK